MDRGSAPDFRRLEQEPAQGRKRRKASPNRRKATVAKYHGSAGQGVDMAEQMDQARAFANGPLRLALAQGASLDADSRRRVADRFARLTGLDADYVMKNDLRVLDFRFRKELLCQEGKIVGCYDGRTAGYALDQTSEDVTFTVDDTYWIPPMQAYATPNCATNRAGGTGRSARVSPISIWIPLNQARAGTGGTSSRTMPSPPGGTRSPSRMSPRTWRPPSHTIPR
ncbi:hypothetical protein [Bifidobacterium favimelis]|uniref:Uncharacterized protein n=1 Tax=Bifidobacterium favimelis TaxID=3122979 RepID=A0ABU8ZM01_9BIFI